MSPKVAMYHRVALERLDAYNKNKGAIEWAMWKCAANRLSRELHREALNNAKQMQQVR